MAKQFRSKFQQWLIDSQFGRWLDKIMNPLGKYLDNTLNYYTHSGMTDDTKETLDYEQQLKEDWYARHESMPAKVAEYNEAGINPLMLAGNPVAASSAPSASPSGGDLGSVLGAALQFGVEKYRTDVNAKLKQQDIDNVKTRNDIERDRVDALSRLYASQERLNVERTIQVSLDNSLFGLRRNSLEKDIQLKDKNISQIGQWIQESITRMYVNRAEVKNLYAQADEITQRRLCEAVQEQILKAQEKYSDEYFEALKNIAQAQSTIDTATSEAVKDNMKLYKDNLIAEWRGKIIATGKEAAIYDSEWFKQFCAGKMTIKERAELWGNIVSRVVTAGIAGATAIGVQAMRSANVATGGMFVPSYGVPTFSGPSVGGVPGS